MKKRIFKLFALIVGLALLTGASGATAQKPTKRTPYQTWDGKEEVAVQQQARNVKLIGSYHTGQSYDVAVDENYAYVAATGNGLRIINISDPEAPTETGFYDTPGDAYGVAVAGNYAYVADWEAGLRIINVSNPAAPNETGYYDTPGNAYGVAVAGNFAYIADMDSGLRIIDVSNPAIPNEVGFYDTTGIALDVTVDGDYAYVVDGSNGLRIINVSNHEAPTETGFYDTPGDAYDVAVAGNFAYVADGTNGLRIINVLNPAAPTETSFYDTPDWAYSVAVAGDTSTGSGQVYAYVADRAGWLRVINVSDPGAPKEVGYYEFPHGSAWGVALDGVYDAYVANDNKGLDILRYYPYQIYLPCITRPCLPLFSDDFSDPNSGWPVKDDGNLRYEYLDGEYRILVRKTDWWAAARPGFQASDYIFAADVRNMAGTWGSYGLIFGISSDWSQFYTFEIFPDGYYGIYRYNSGIWTPFTEGTSSSINTGSAKNRLRIKREGNLIEAYVNGELLVGLSEGSYTGIRYMGLFSGTYDESNLDVRFDNFVVYPVTCNLDGAQIGETIQTPNLKDSEFPELWQIFNQPHSRDR